MRAGRAAGIILIALLIPGCTQSGLTRATVSSPTSPSGAEDPQGLVPVAVRVAGDESGSSTPPVDAEEFIYARQPAHEFSTEGAFSADHHLLMFEFFNATAASSATFAFRVEDGGTASVCFLSQESLHEELAYRYLPPEHRSYVFNGTHACSGDAASAEGRVSLPAGPLVFAVLTKDCPHLDCSIGINKTYEGHVSLNWIGEAERLFGNGSAAD